jgi:hypothetical protein
VVSTQSTTRYKGHIFFFFFFFSFFFFLMFKFIFINIDVYDDSVLYKNAALPHSLSLMPTPCPVTCQTPENHEKRGRES